MLNKDATSLGIWFGVFICTLWWNIDWSRYIKRNLLRVPPYSPWLTIVVRVFLALFTLGSFFRLVGQWPRGIQSIKFYGTALAIAVVLFACCVLIANFREWLNIKGNIPKS
jgi:hypothetical protein